MEIYEKIKSRRKELGLSAEDVAESLGISRATVYRYESADIEKLPITSLVPLAKVLKCSPGYLMGWEKDPEGQPEVFSLLEKEIVYRYRVAPRGIKESVCKLLDISQDEKGDASETSSDIA